VEAEAVMVVMASIIRSRRVMGRGVEEGEGEGETVVETGDMEAGMTMEVVVGVVLCERTSWRIDALG
jgi:hypothetical protein